MVIRGKEAGSIRERAGRSSWGSGNILGLHLSAGYRSGLPVGLFTFWRLWAALEEGELSWATF